MTKIKKETKTNIYLKRVQHFILKHDKSYRHDNRTGYGTLNHIDKLHNIYNSRLGYIYSYRLDTI